MIVLSNKKFLTLLLAATVVSCSFVGVVDAGHLRREDKEQKRKLMKSSKANSEAGGTNTNTYSLSRPIGIDPPVLANGVDTSNFGQGCTRDEAALNSCVMTSGGSEDDLETCHICIRGAATIRTENTKGLRACSNPLFGGFCKECYDEVSAFYECGRGTTAGAIPTPPVGETAPTGGGTGGGGEGDATPGSANPNAGASASAPVNTMELYAPMTNCPLKEPKSGTGCKVPGGFKYTECRFDNVKCTCREDTETWMCYDTN